LALEWRPGNGPPFFSHDSKHESSEMFKPVRVTVIFGVLGFDPVMGKMPARPARKASPHPPPTLEAGITDEHVNLTAPYRGGNSG